jgi:amylosucrase
MCYDTREIPDEYEKTVPQVFPNTAPGNFIFCGEMGKYVLSTFNPYQWDMNYKNPVVFNEMACNMLYLANVGIEIFRIDAVPYIWKELGTSCRNLPQVHTIMRMLRIIAKAVCPAVVFKGEVVMAPHEVAPYFGPVDKPECDILYNVTTMVCVWNSLATRDVTLLKWQMDAMDALPPEFTFVNYVRCHDDIGWGLEESAVQYLGSDPLEHKKFLYHFYIGDYPGSFARGELYNYDPVSQDARSCGTCASLCGIEKALDECDPGALGLAVSRHLMIHAYIASLSGIPVIYSGDELAQLNDNRYTDDPVKAVDSRFIHRGKLDWARAEKRLDRETVPGLVFQALQKLIRLRAENPVFNAGARERTLDSGDKAVLAFRREGGGQTLTAVYNFSEFPKHVQPVQGGRCRDLLTGRDYADGAFEIGAYQALWLLKA